MRRRGESGRGNGLAKREGNGFHVRELSPARVAPLRFSMTILPLDPLANRSLDALLVFLGGVRAQAEADGRPRLVIL